MFPMKNVINKGLTFPVELFMYDISAMSCEINPPDEFHIYHIIFIRFILSLMLYATLVLMIIHEI